MPQQTGKSLIIERILRDREGIWQQVVEQRDLSGMTLHMLATSVLSFAAYGIVLGASHSVAQAASSAVKLPLLFLATLAICLPTLYLFNLIFGARLSMMQAITLIMVCITVISVLCLAFAPISLFFLITADNYPFFKLLNVAILVLSALVGLRFLTAGMARLNAYQQFQHETVAPPVVAPVVAPIVAPIVAAAEAPGIPVQDLGNGSVAVLPKTAPVAVLTPAPAPASAYKPASMTLLYIWIALFGFVGTQLAWTLRPFFGTPDAGFQVFRNIEGTFYADIFRTIGHLFGG